MEIIENFHEQLHATGQIIVDIESVVFCSSAWALPAQTEPQLSTTETPQPATCKQRKYGPRSVPLGVSTSAEQKAGPNKAAEGPL